MLMIRAFHNALDLQFIHDDVGICFRVGVAGMENVLFVFRIEAELFQIVLSLLKSLPTAKKRIRKSINFLMIEKLAKSCELSVVQILKLLLPE